MNRPDRSALVPQHLQYPYNVAAQPAPLSPRIRHDDPLFAASRWSRPAGRGSGRQREPVQKLKVGDSSKDETVIKTGGAEVTGTHDQSVSAVATRKRP